MLRATAPPPGEVWLRAAILLLALMASSSSVPGVDAGFAAPAPRKGFGGGGGMAATGTSGKNKNTAKPKKKPSPKQLAKQLQQTYGGTTPEQIAQGTQRRIDATLQAQPPSIQQAIPLYQKLQQWNSQLQSIPLAEQTKMFSPEDMEGAKRAQDELTNLLASVENDGSDNIGEQARMWTERDLHNLLQQATWDASADAKAARSITGKMPADIQKRVQRACDRIASSITSDDSNDSTTKKRILDVGCGFGVLVPFLKQAGLVDDQIYGIDLSPEMIRHAQDWYPQCHFEAGDFYTYEPPPTTNDEDELLLFDSLIFCAALHDMPDMMEATLPKARELLQPNGGTLVIVHPQGSAHVQNQVRTNPSMVSRGLPTTKELEAFEGFRLVQAPAAPKSREDERDGYLAILERV